MKQQLKDAVTRRAQLALQHKQAGKHAAQQLQVPLFTLRNCMHVGQGLQTPMLL